MNFTDQYIKMCNCEEVQKCAPAGYKIREMYIDQCMVCCGDKDGLYYETYTFVPYQHDIQSMIRSYVNCAYRLLQDFYYWCGIQRKEHIERVKGATMEELWLMFYMWREHYKVWENGEWVQLKEKIIETVKK